ncbi:MAG: FIST N-terminal domain-containing protein [Synechococcus sp.]|nr:FIST N-terminal domain-containing protein [Synechococcus sp.]
MATFSPLGWFRSFTGESHCRSALSTHPSLDEAVKDVVGQLGRRGEADLALVFASTGYASDLPRLLPLLRQELKSRHWIGAAGGGVVGTRSDGSAAEVEQAPSLSVTLLRLPGARIEAAALSTDTLPDLDGPAQQWQDWSGLNPEDSRSQILLIDPTSSNINDLISGLDYAYPSATKIGGIACPHNAPHGSLLFDDRVVTGSVICSIGGDWRLDSVVAQGCRPIGPVFAIEQVQRNVVLELSDGERRDTPVACLQRVLADLTSEERERVRHSLFLGIERRNLQLNPERPEASDGAFLVRNLIGVDPKNGAVAVAERVRPGMNVQFQLREADASRDEALTLLQAACASDATTPVFGLLMACLGRGQGLFGTPDGDVSLGRQVLPDLPMAGAFCNGEIGPVAGSTHLHGYTACWGLLRQDRGSVAG